MELVYVWFGIVSLLVFFIFRVMWYGFYIVLVKKFMWFWLIEGILYILRVVRILEWRNIF